MTSGAAYGVVGVNKSPQGAGVFGKSNSAAGTGVEGKSGSAGNGVTAQGRNGVAATGVDHGVIATGRQGRSSLRRATRLPRRTRELGQPRRTRHATNRRHAGHVVSGSASTGPASGESSSATTRPERCIPSPRLACTTRARPLPRRASWPPAPTGWCRWPTAATSAPAPSRRRVWFRQVLERSPTTSPWSASWLSLDRIIKVFCGGTGGTHFIIDITGYYL